LSERSNTFDGRQQFMRDTCLQEGEHLVFTLGFLQLLVGGDVPDAQYPTLFVVVKDTLKTDLHLEEGRILLVVFSRGWS
jgi:hypothetical protein